MWVSLVSQRVKNLPANAGDAGQPWVRKIPREGNDSALQYSYLGDLMDRVAWQATIHEVAEESDTT